MEINQTIVVVVPVYNTGEYRLKRCITSLTQQTYQNIKIIIVDDGSTDETGDVCDKLQLEDTRISVIHQKNQGSIKARKNGVLSQIAQEAEYIMFCDSDDTLSLDAVEKLFSRAVEYDADCVCGNMQHLRGSIKYVPNRECFQISEPHYYSRKDIIQHIYLSCFGLIDYPVSYCAKLYRTHILTEAFDYTPVVKFMGDDLNTSIRLIPKLNSLVIIPEVVYHYFDGGFTSRFMPYAFDDFLALYQLKQEYANKYFKEKIKLAYHFMDNEMMWITLARFTDCYVYGGYTKTRMQDEIKRVCEIEIVNNSAEYVVTEDDHYLKNFAKDILEHNYKSIWIFVQKESIKKRIRKVVKKILSLIPQK